jgi:hypothetical protein
MCRHNNCSCPDGFGFVLDDLVVAPLFKYKNEDCGQFHNNYLLSPECLSAGATNTDDFNRTVFDILDYVSGRSSFNQSLPATIDKFHFYINDSGLTLQQDSSFLAFNGRCKPGKVTSFKLHVLSPQAR